MKVLIDIDEFKDWLKDEVYKTDLSEVMPIIDHYFETSDNRDKLSDAEQRLFLSAIARETKVCKAIDTDKKFADTNIRLLTPMIENIERKVKAVLFWK